MAPAEHCRTVSRRKITCLLQFGNSLLAGIDYVGVLFALKREGHHAEHSVLAFKRYLHAVENVVCDKRWYSTQTETARHYSHAAFQRFR